jgi:hypothetical protein
MSDSALVRFYRGAAPDGSGRTLARVWAWSDAELEAVHDYIQWLFPLPEASNFNDAAPLLTSADIAAFRASELLRDNLRISFGRMLDFYGFVLTAERAILRGPDFAARAQNWLRPLNHNFLRLTRILRASALLGLGDEARALLLCLEELYQGHAEIIGARTMAFWRGAIAASSADPEIPRPDD